MVWGEELRVRELQCDMEEMRWCVSGLWVGVGGGEKTENGAKLYNVHCKTRKLQLT